MSKSYKIKVNQGGGEAKFVDIPQVSGGGQPLAVKAVPGGKYQLVDASTGYGPENIRASRSGQSLKVYFEGRSQPDLVIEDYYKETPEGFNGLIGESESGRFHEYIPETAAGTSAVPLLADGSNQVGMALGGAEINASGAAVGALVAAAGLNPLLLAPLALLGAAGGGGGGGGGGDITNNNTAGIKITKATLDTGVSSSDFVTQGPVTEFSGTLSTFTGTPGDKVKLELLDKDGKALDPVISGTVTPTQVNGVWTWKWTPIDNDTTTNLPDVLKEGDYTLKATIVTAVGVAYTHATASTTQALDIDTSPNEGDNKNTVISITSVSDDTGTLNNDWLTSDTSLVFEGTLNKFSAALGDVVMLTLDPVTDGASTIVQYVAPVLKDNVWGWEWDAQTTPFPQGTYNLSATLVDKAGNAFTHAGAKADKVLVIDTSGPQGDKGLSIVSMSVDSGVGGETDLSRIDFKTNDNTPVFTGKLSTVLPQGESIVIQLMEGNKVVDTGVATVDSSGTAWTWTPKAPLADATYQLKAQVVDAAGNPAVTSGTTTVIPPANRDVVVDTKGSTDVDDGNKGLKTTGISLSTDTAGEQKTNSDFVTSDGANKDSVTGNDDDKLTFTGTLSSSFTKNGGKVWVQIIDANGVAKSNAYVEPETINSNSWKYENLVPLAEGQYVAKSILMDHVGNIISASDQSFFIDKTNATWTPVGQSNTINDSTVTSVKYENYSFSMGESGTYRFGTGGETKNYNGGTLIFDAAGKTFSSGQFIIDFWDQAGNLTQITNKDQTWIFGTAAPAVMPQPTDATYLASKDFAGLKTVGTVGKIDVSSNFDMASLYDGIDSVLDKAAANHVVLSNTSDVILNVSMGDVLALGVTNSFSIAVGANSLHKGQTQMRIDGQSGDQVNLDGLVNGEKWVWTGGENSTNSPLGIGSDTYDVYTNTALGVALFIDQDVKVNIL